jgi:hypothetical protein
VDDIFAIISREWDPKAILTQVNTNSDTVKFTLEKEREVSLAFLDVKNHKKTEVNWQHQVIERQLILEDI